MEKKLNRQIGYKRPAPQKKETPVIKPAVQKPEAKTKQKAPAPVTDKPTAKDLYKFLKDRPLIKIGPLCEGLGMDRSNFCVYIGKGRELPQETVDKFVDALRLYGWPA